VERADSKASRATHDVSSGFISAPLAKAHLLHLSKVLAAQAFNSADEIISKVKASPELLDAIKTMQGCGIKIEAAGEVIDIETVIRSGAEGEFEEEDEA
jgi:hypothetical protein